MKKTLSILIISVFLLSVIPILAQEEIATPEDIDLAGIITPDNILYPLELALERITELFSENAKLKHARERLAEVRVMIQENKIEDAEKARQNFNRLKNRIQNQTKIKEHIELMDNLGQRISAIASLKGQLTDEQRENIRLLILDHKDRIKIEDDELEKEIDDVEEEQEEETNETQASRVQTTIRNYP